VAAFIREGLTVAHLTPGGIKKQKGGGGDDMTVPEFAMPPDAVPGIAQVIVDIWQNKPGLDKIFDRNQTGAHKGMATQDAVDQATVAINAAAPKFNLQRAVIIKEEEHDAGYTMQTENDVVFVLPRPERADLTGTDLLNTAKLLMACTPNGI
jgi:hypothetical protein